MGARCARPDVREVQVLGDQEAPAGLGGLPHDGVVLPGDPFGRHRVDVVAQLSEHRDELAGQVLVELDSHRTWVSATGSSSCADAAANAMAARMSGAAPRSL